MTFFERLKELRTGKPLSFWGKGGAFASTPCFHLAKGSVLSHRLAYSELYKSPLFSFLLSGSHVTLFAYICQISLQLRPRGRLGWISMNGHRERPSVPSPLDLYWRGLPWSCWKPPLLVWLLKKWCLQLALGLLWENLNSWLELFRILLPSESRSHLLWYRTSELQMWLQITLEKEEAQLVGSSHTAMSGSLEVVAFSLIGRSYTSRILNW